MATLVQAPTDREEDNNDGRPETSDRQIGQVVLQWMDVVISRYRLRSWQQVTEIFEAYASMLTKVESAARECTRSATLRARRTEERRRVAQADGEGGEIQEDGMKRAKGRKGR
eukprot:3085379-Rhodomonas_salina.1